MRAKQSSTAIGMVRRAGELELPPRKLVLSRGAESSGSFVRFNSGQENCPAGPDSTTSGRGSGVTPEKFPGDGLLHDARNLVSAIGLYCDLLSMPGVLKPEHRKYPDELRLLGTRSQEMIEHLMDSLSSRQSGVPARGRSLSARTGAGESPQAAGEHGYRAGLVSLRSIVERCSGLLSRVANGRAIEVIYGPAAEMPIRIAEEWVERILVNLVRNGSAALGEGHAPIRILVGPLARHVGEAQAWPFERVRLVIEDAGCGMEPFQLDALLSGRGLALRGNHGIGFRVVRELVTASNGELSAASARGIGTRVQIEWPVAAMAASGKGEEGRMRQRAPKAEQHPAVAKTIARTGVHAGPAEERQGAH